MKSIRAIILLFCLIAFTNVAVADGIVVAFEKKEYSVLAGKTENITPVIQGTKQKGQLSYSSSNVSVATVKNGQVKGISVGDATIKCEAKIGNDVYTCSYIIHVLQPVTEILVPVKEMTLPANAVLRELPYRVYPEDAANKEIEILCDGKKQSLNQDGKFPASSLAMNKIYTFKTMDGSGITAKFKYIVPRVAWFSIENNTTIDSPEGIDFFYVPTYEPGGMMFSVNAYDDNKFIKCEEKYINKAILDELIKNEPYYLNYDTSATRPGYVHIVPLKVGKGTYTVVVNGHKATIKMNITRSAVYESIKYEQYEKAEAKNKSLRFQILGTISSINPDGLKVSFEGDETKQVSITIPKAMDISTLAIGEQITVKGIFLEMSTYKTDTGLTKKIPVISAEIIE